MTTTRSSRRSSTSTSTSSAKKSRRKNQTRDRHVCQRASKDAVIAERVMAIKQLLVNDASVGDVLDEFFEGFMTEPSMLFEFRTMRQMWLHDAIARSCEEILERPTGSGAVKLMEVPPIGLIHGSIWFEGYLGVAVYFEDIQLGAVGLFPEDHPERALLARLVCIKNKADPRTAPN